MDAWMRDTHRSTARVLTALDVTYALPGHGGGCCGALHAHAGLSDRARDLAEAVMASMPGDAPILVDSAGCGAAMKEYGHALDTDDARRFSARVVDVHEFVAPRLDRLGELRRRDHPVVIQDPCHLRHVQREHQHVRTVVSRFAEIVEIDDDGVCCGAGGAYSALQPDMARQMRDRKIEAIERVTSASGATMVASANPGCAMHLGAVSALPVRHPMDLLAEALT
jgi:glycolate oxidase iron-sulfur subunit